MEILEHQTLDLRNVLTFRGKITQQELSQRLQEIDGIIKSAHAKRTKVAITATYAIDSKNGLLDMEILIPLDREIPVPKGYIWKSRFLLTNAVVVHHVGHPSGLENSVNELNAYIAEHGLVPITTGYNVTEKEATNPYHLDEMVVNVYVGISPNIL